MKNWQSKEMGNIGHNTLNKGNIGHNTQNKANPNVFFFLHCKTSLKIRKGLSKSGKSKKTRQYNGKQKKTKKKQ